MIDTRLNCSVSQTSLHNTGFTVTKVTSTFDITLPKFLIEFKRIEEKKNLKNIWTALPEEKASKIKKI